MATGSRILELVPSQEEAIVARVLVLVHQAVDEHFPSAEKASRQFTKTVFSDEANEQTAVGHVPPDDGAAAPSSFAESEKTSPDGRPGDLESPSGGHASAVPPAPPYRSPLEQTRPPRAAAQASAPSAQKNQISGKLGWQDGAAGVEAPASLDADADASFTTVETFRRDWQMILVLALLIAGLILLAYALLS